MISGNIQNLPASGYHFVLGVYPNDQETLAAARRLERKFPSKVNVVVNRRNGPTSKGQMLNEMFAQSFSRSSFRGKQPPDLVIIHDSEDLIAAASFDVYRSLAHDSAMIQIPVFSLDSRHRSLVGATYMEEFAERHTREMLLRSQLGAFVPSAGVGTCLRRDLIEHMLAVRGHVMQSGCVTEDYILGAEAQAAGFSTSFAAFRDPSLPHHPIIATLEYFPKDFWASIRQKTRWVYGIAFESAARLGWNMSGWNLFFSYRDRKGAVANFLPFLSLLVLSWGLYLQPDFTSLSPATTAMLIAVLGLNTANILIRFIARATAFRTVYGHYNLAGLIMRWPVSLVVNALAAARAWRTYVVESGFASRSVSWAKTAHELPTTFDFVKQGVAGPKAVPVPAQVRRRAVWRQKPVIAMAVAGLVVAATTTALLEQRSRQAPEGVQVAALISDTSKPATSATTKPVPAVAGPLVANGMGDANSVTDSSAKSAAGQTTVGKTTEVADKATRSRSRLSQNVQKSIMEGENADFEILRLAAYQRAIAPTQRRQATMTDAMPSATALITGSIRRRGLSRPPVDRAEITRSARYALNTSAMRDHKIIEQFQSRARSEAAAKKNAAFQVVRAVIDESRLSDADILQRAERERDLVKINREAQARDVSGRRQLFSDNLRADAEIAAKSTIRSAELMEGRLRERIIRQRQRTREIRIAMSMPDSANVVMARLLAQSSIEAGAGQDRAILSRMTLQPITSARVAANPDPAESVAAKPATTSTAIERKQSSNVAPEIRDLVPDSTRKPTKQRSAVAESNAKVLRALLPPEVFSTDGQASSDINDEVRAAQAWANAWLQANGLSLVDIGIGRRTARCGEGLCVDGILGAKTRRVLVYIFDKRQTVAGEKKDD